MLRSKNICYSSRPRGSPGTWQHPAGAIRGENVIWTEIARGNERQRRTRDDGDGSGQNAAHGASGARRTRARVLRTSSSFFADKYQN